MNQKFSWAMFAAGMPTFLLTAGEMLKEHNQWSYFYQTPLGFIHALVLGAAFSALVTGAIGIQLPRSDDGTHAQRKSDQVTSADSPDGTVTTITTTKETTPVKETP
jgi:hypothetical protein